MSDFFNDMKDAYEEIVAHKKGKITLRSETIEIPDMPKIQDCYLIVPLSASEDAKSKMNDEAKVKTPW